jgi:uncharacterized protein
MILPVTLTAAGLAALVNIWLGIRVGQVRTREKVSIGDGGNDAVIRRMRAHANYVENAPFFVLLVAGIELANSTGPAPTWLWAVTGIYFLGRIAHGLGMDDGKFGKGRMIGTLINMITLLGLGLYALSIPYMSDGTAQPVTPIDMQDAEILPQG